MTRLREALANRGFRRLRRRSAMQFSRQPESASANCRCPKRDWPRIFFLEEQTLHSRGVGLLDQLQVEGDADRKSTRLNSSHSQISYAVFCLNKQHHDD